MTTSTLAYHYSGPGGEPSHERLLGAALDYVYQAFRAVVELEIARDGNNKISTHGPASADML